MPGVASQTNSRSHNLGGNFGKKHALKKLKTFFNWVPYFFFSTSVYYFVGCGSSFFVKSLKTSFTFILVCV
jgi:hypothetical protein